MAIETLPIIRLGQHLLVNLQGDLDDKAVLDLEAGITDLVSRTRVDGVLIEVSGLAVVDSFIARVLARVAAMIRLLGCETVVVGIQPAVAITLTELGIGLEHLNTALNAAEGITLLQRLRGR